MREAMASEVRQTAVDGEGKRAEIDPFPPEHMGKWALRGILWNANSVPDVTLKSFWQALQRQRGARPGTTARPDSRATAMRTERLALVARPPEPNKDPLDLLTTHPHHGR
jgi:hypothetical protein